MNPSAGPALRVAHVVGRHREAVVGRDTDPGEGEAFALADAHDGRLLTDDGDARTFAKELRVTVIGSVGILLASIDAGRFEKRNADGWLRTWINDFG